MASKNCLVLGGSGFIGSHLVRSLAECGHYVTSLGKENALTPINSVNYVLGDICDDTVFEIIKKNKYDFVFHLFSSVSPSSTAPDIYNAYQKDIYATTQILEWLKLSKSTMIFASSGGTVYGDNGNEPFLETSQLTPMTHYAVSKVTIEMLINMYNHQHGSSHKILRIANPYGPGQDYEKGVGLVDAILKRAIQNEQVVIYGDGSAIRDYIHIDDLIVGICAAMRYTGDECVFNIGTGVGTSINQLLQAVRCISNKNVSVMHDSSRPSDVPYSVLDVKKASSIINFTAKINITDGLSSYYELLKTKIGE